MKTYTEIMKSLHGDAFDIVVRSDNSLEYRFFVPMSICSNGKIAALGISYKKETVLVSADDTTVIGSGEMDEKTYDKLYFVEDPDKYCRLIGANVKDLIGCDREFFYAEANRRARGEF